jgi:hypothetical protein
MESLEKPWHRALCLCSLCAASYIQKTLSIPASFEMDGGGSSLGGSHQGEEEQKNKKESMLTDSEYIYILCLLTDLPVYTILINLHI